MLGQDQIQQKYFFRAKLAANVLRLAPFVRMVALTGSLARGEASKNSDIDFFIVARQGRIWTARFFTTFFTHLLSIRRYNNKIAGRICLNCYQTEDSLEIHPKNKKNALDYAHLTPLWQIHGNYPGFLKANTWIKKYRQFHPLENQERDILKFLKIFQLIFETILELFLNNWLEEKLRRLQIKKILANPLTRRARKNEIFISDKELRFHPRKKNIDK